MRTNPGSIIAAGLGAASLIALTQILTLKLPLDRCLSIAVLCFAISLPFLAIWSASTVEFPPANLTLAPEHMKLLYAFSNYSWICLIDVVGFALIFFHFGRAAGLLFVVCAWLAFRTTYHGPVMGLVRVLVKLPVVRILVATGIWTLEQLLLRKKR